MRLSRKSLAIFRKLGLEAARMISSDSSKATNRFADSERDRDHPHQSRHVAKARGRLERDHGRTIVPGIAVDVPASAKGFQKASNQGFSRTTGRVPSEDRHARCLETLALPLRFPPTGRLQNVFEVFSAKRNFQITVFRSKRASQWWPFYYPVANSTPISCERRDQFRRASNFNLVSKSMFSKGSGSAMQKHPCA
jgi:hypothetical protein